MSEAPTGPLIVLASTSRYRRALLERLTLPFETAAPEVDETRAPGEPPPDLVRRLAEAKARAIAPRYPGALIIGSDQVACLEDEVLGKPGGYEAAVAQLAASAGRTVTFLTAVCVLDTRTDEAQLDIVPYEVHFRALPRERLERYVSHEQPYECAGSIRSEAYGVTLFEYMRGDDPTALMGLPLIRLVAMFERVGIDLP